MLTGRESGHHTFLPDIIFFCQYFFVQKTIPYLKFGFFRNKYPWPDDDIQASASGMCLSPYIVQAADPYENFEYKTISMQIQGAEIFAKQNVVSRQTSSFSYLLT